MPEQGVTKVGAVVCCLFAAAFAVTSSTHAQTPVDSTRRAIPRFKLEYSGLSASGAARAGVFLGDLGSRAALLGEESGGADVWIWPDKLVSELRFAFKTPGPSAAIEASTIAQTATARPEASTVTYAHPAFTVTQHWFVPLAEAGAIILLDVQAVQPLEIQVRFLMTGNIALQRNALIGSPFATKDAAGGSLAPSPGELVLVVDPATAQTHYIPIIIVGGDSAAHTYERLLNNVPMLWAQKVAHYQRLRGETLSVETPDERIDRAFEWSKVNLDQRLACNPVGRCGFSGAAAIQSIGIGTVGDFERVRETLASIAKQQSESGRIADEIAPEDTPLWLLAYHQYWNAAGDDDALEQQWPNLVRAFRWSAAADVNDDALMDNAATGVNTQPGRSVSTDSLLTDIHLAGVWAAALEGVQHMARARKDNRTLKHAAELAAQAQRTLEETFWNDSTGMYGFALMRRTEPAASEKNYMDGALTAWPATAMSFGLLDAERSERMLAEIGASAITADWGTRILSSQDPRYDSLHYSNGAVWSHITGTVALAHYQQHRAWAGFDLVRAGARAHFDFANGRPPELLSGASYRALDAAAPQQFLASATFVLPVARGLIGWHVDAQHHAAALEPHLPAEWATMRASNLPVGDDRIEAVVSRDAGVYTINLRRLTQGEPIALRIAPALPLGARLERVVVNDADAPVQTEETTHDLHGVTEVQLVRDAQIEFHYSGGVEIITPVQSVEVGGASKELRVLNFRRDGRDYTAVLEGAAGSVHVMRLRSEARVRTVQGSDSFEQKDERVEAAITMPEGVGFVRKTIRIKI